MYTTWKTRHLIKRCDEILADPRTRTIIEGRPGMTNVQEGLPILLFRMSDAISARESAAKSSVPSSMMAAYSTG